jgi:HlyD family secretion protein
VALLGVAPAYLLSREEVVDVTAMTVDRGRVEDTVTAIASGTVMARLDSMIASEIMGTVVTIHFEEGDHVEPGEVLAELNHAEWDAQVALAEANLKVGRSRLEQARLAATIYEEVAATRVSQTGAQLEQARSDFERIKTLAERKAISDSAFEQTALALRVAQEAAAAAKSSQRETLVRQEEIRSAEAAIEQLEAAVQVATATRDKAFVRAPFPGTVARVLCDQGQGVTLGMPLLQLVHVTDCYVEAPFDEANASEIAVGQNVRINLDAYRGVDFPGRVTYVSPTVTMNMDLSRTLNIKVSIEQGRERFVPGMSADVIIVADEKEDVLFVPTESLIREEYVYLIEDGRAARRDLKLGIGNWRTIEVLDGLSEGDTIVTSVSVGGLDDGVRVRVLDQLED